ncbi:MAG: hypothetical protein HZB38_01415 [Planctomycetes bacterium]|nr:hypothetical protein [Planctomycetota bacterium]
MAQSTRNTVVLVVALVLLGVAGWRLLGTGRPPGTLPSHSAHEAACLACKSRVQVEHSVREIAPYICPKCGERASYTLMYCTECKSVFVPNLVYNEVEKAYGPPMIPACLKCSGTHAVGLEPRDPTQAPQGDMLLPKWPP